MGPGTDARAQVDQPRKVRSRSAHARVGTNEWYRRQLRGNRGTACSELPKRQRYGPDQVPKKRLSHNVFPFKVDEHDAPWTANKSGEHPEAIAQLIGWRLSHEDELFVGTIAYDAEATVEDLGNREDGGVVRAEKPSSCLPRARRSTGQRNE